MADALFDQLHYLPIGYRARTERVEVDFGHAAAGEGDSVEVSVSAPWVTSATRILCQISTRCAPDHDEDDPVVENLSARLVFRGDVLINGYFE